MSQANLVTKTIFDNTVSSPDTKTLQRLLKSLRSPKFSYFKGKNYFEEDGTQNYLLFQPVYRYFKVVANTDYVSSWKSKELSPETIKAPAIYALPQH